LNECGLATNQYLTNEIKMKIEALHHHHIWSYNFWPFLIYVDGNLFVLHTRAE
jgi:hypothetical protein